VSKETAEVAVLAEYLPQQMSEEEVNAAIEAAIAELGLAGPAAMGKVMGLLKPRLAGRADIGQVSAVVKRRLAG
jgi:uncharacterized protein